ncbi:hypothetical protein GGI05_000611, partial [Coemansia sp. RSA 2603]
MNLPTNSEKYSSKPRLRSQAPLQQCLQQHIERKLANQPPHQSLNTPVSRMARNSLTPVNKMKPGNWNTTTNLMKKPTTSLKMPITPHQLTSIVSEEAHRSMSTHVAKVSKLVSNSLTTLPTNKSTQVASLPSQHTPLTMSTVQQTRPSMPFYKSWNAQIAMLQSKMQAVWSLQSSPPTGISKMTGFKPWERSLTSLPMTCAS